MKTHSDLPPGVSSTMRLTSTALGEYRTFLTEAVRNPRRVGAPTPTSGAVASLVSQVVPTTGSPVVVELGPGTGSLSNAIHDRLPAGARHVGIELADNLVRHLRANKPWLEVVHGDAANLVSLLGGLGITQVDALVTSIPWSLLDGAVQDEVMRQSATVLAPHGAFTALTYLPAERNPGGRRFRELLDSTFDEVLTCVTWRNFPPILHYICRRPMRLESPAGADQRPAEKVSPRP